MSPEPLDHPLNVLAEGPIWRPTENALYWTDIMDQRLWRWKHGGGPAEALTTGYLLVGGFCFDVADNLLLCTNRGVWRWPEPYLQPFGDHAVKVQELPLGADERCNDITVDPAGRLYIGTMRENFTGGTVYRWQPGENAVPIIHDTGCANGMTLSLDERFLFFTESTSHTITRYRWDRDTGLLTNPEPFFVLDAAIGIPDGITLDADNRLWVAAYGGGRVVIVDPTGRIEGEVGIPATQVTSVQFGGPKMTDLFVTTSSFDCTDKSTGRDADGNFLGGRVYRVPNAGRGRPEWVASVE